ncbi:hypothetical protein KIN20_005382 [Parelaphostrongylus tenuis]|uniref:Uncharacterized protein n=1 Tax=Parelaphostrongylus tenuis TaxID=148309 RepID=A0AAD5LZZ9_PARTN|nr:hypothetical protein KIN20_005382 [Parelaphostrongylus tenuis]
MKEKMEKRSAEQSSRKFITTRRFMVLPIIQQSCSSWVCPPAWGTTPHPLLRLDVDCSTTSVASIHS